MVLKLLSKFIIGLVRLVTRRGSGVTKILFTVDDIIRLFAMTLIIMLGLKLLGIHGLFYYLGVIIGLVIDIEDIIQNIASGEMDRGI